jgi:electron transport complex protein RnfD
VGGLALIWLRIITWHTPVALLGALLVMSGAFHLFDPSNTATPFFHLTTGAAMFGAFFIATDPVSSCTSNRGKLIYGAGIGILIYIIRSWGGYPDGVAFGVLLMNFAAPLIDYYTQPRTYGHKKAKTGLKIGEDN